MEKRINKKLNDYIFTYKSHIKDKIQELCVACDSVEDQKLKNLIQEFYDYPNLSFTKEDFQKRKRVKNVVPLHERCCALKAANEQCTRRKKDNSDYCGTHIKGIPHGIVDNVDNNKVAENTERNIMVTAHDFSGIIYYIDDDKNVYNTVDIHNNKSNPKIIAKYIVENGIFKIPEFNI